MISNDMMKTLSDAIGQAMAQFIFEPNDKYTREQLSTTLGKILQEHDAAGVRIVCDETNNTQEAVDLHELRVTAYYELHDHQWFKRDYTVVRDDVNHRALQGE